MRKRLGWKSSRVLTPWHGHCFIWMRSWIHVCHSNIFQCRCSEFLTLDNAIRVNWSVCARACVCVREKGSQWERKREDCSITERHMINRPIRQEHQRTRQNNEGYHRTSILILRPRVPWQARLMKIPPHESPGFATQCAHDAHTRIRAHAYARSCLGYYFPISIWLASLSC